MIYLPFKVTEFNQTRPDKDMIMDSENGSLYIKVGKLDIHIKQSDDGEGVIIDCTDSKTCEQDLGTFMIWYDDIEEINQD